MPLRLGVERPPADGWLGPIFDWFRAMDKPHNLFPSLHIALRTILAELYARHTRGVLRWMSHIWFSLIGLSTLLTYQHHVIDIVGGFALALVCLYAVPAEAAGVRTPANFRIARYYVAGAAIVAALAVAFWQYEGWILLWPVTSLSLVAAAYLGSGPSIYRKRDGRIALAAKLMLWPVLAGQWLSMRHYARRGSAWSQASDQVWIGRQLSESEAGELHKHGVVAVVDLTAEFSAPESLRVLEHLNLQVLDLCAPSQEQIKHAVAFIQEHASRGKVYVHCKAGYSRSAAVVGAYLIASGCAKDAGHAIALLRTARPAIVVRPEAEQAIRDYRAHSD
ncbi:MAG: dual specificity protein phosphatase family protein [Phycisphaerales bacterium]|nr:dual specificity protein phosphatase family protein [Phycisphaerales bacterium]MCI0676343.1 dual specificity protein phosphatase family protein [Phycisphaerales bacterium]